MLKVSLELIWKARSRESDCQTLPYAIHSLGFSIFVKCLTYNWYEVSPSSTGVDFGQFSMANVTFILSVNKETHEKHESCEILTFEAKNDKVQIICVLFIYLFSLNYM